MSDHSRQVQGRLPPIGFEHYLSASPDLPVKQLKKRRRRKSSLKHLKNLEIAASGFQSRSQKLPDTGTGYSDSEPHLAPDVVDSGVFKANSLLKKRGKKFSLQDLHQDQPDWIKEQKRIMASSGLIGSDIKEQLAELYGREERSRVDFVLIYRKSQVKEKGGVDANDNADDHDDRIKEARREQKRKRFHKLLVENDFEIEEEEVGDLVYVKLQCTFRRLCREAETMRLQMPLKGMKAKSEDGGCCTDCIERTFVTDNEEDYVSATFEQSKLHLFMNCENIDTFYRSSLRGLLIDHILKNLDMRSLPKTIQYYYYHDEGDDPDEDILSKQGLPYLIHKKVYIDSFTLHEPSADELKESEANRSIEDAMVDKGGKAVEKRATSAKRQEALSKVIELYGDPRKDLNDTWPKISKFQPLWRVRNYFGEEIALYFAWIGLMVYSLVIPTLLGIGVFGWGMAKSVGIHNDTIGSSFNTNSTEIDQVVAEALKLLDLVKAAFDNEATPFYSILICIWCTVFLELWKRKNAVLAYEWDVESFEDVEPDRPEYYGVHNQKDIDPITGEPMKYYPFHYRCIKYSVSVATFFFMVAIVICVVVSVVIYRVIINVDFCLPTNTTSGMKEPEFNSTTCFFITTVCSSLLNAIAIMVLGKIYEKLAYQLTKWENHRTESAHRNALIVKLFAFQFANNYSSLYYIAFFRESDFTDGAGILGLNSRYADSCGSGGFGNTCMSQLSFQVLVLMLVKPVPKFLKDVILPWLVGALKRCCAKKKKVEPSQPDPERNAEDDLETNFLEEERTKPQLSDFTLGEYTEKVIQYGFLTLFAAAMPLAPLIVVCVNLLDRYVDSKRLLWMYRRPIANIAQDMGMWYPILEFMNIAAVITNGFIIAYVSSWGQHYPSLWPNGYGDDDKLWTVLVFEHLVFGLKYLLDIAIPDVPQRVRIAMRKEKYVVAKILDMGMFTKDLSKNLNIAKPHHQKLSQREETFDDTATSGRVNLSSVNSSPRRRRTPSVEPYAHEPVDVTDAPSSVRRTSKPIKLEYGPDGEQYISQ